jgi:hypothetical protein
MTETKAVELLRAQKDKIPLFTELTADSFQTHTTSYISEIFGEKSEEMKFINNISFQSRTMYVTHDQQREWTSIGMTDFLNNCIDTVMNKGVYKPQKINFFYTIDVKWILASALGLLVGSFVAGYNFGDRLNNSDLKIENSALRDSLRRLPINR